MVDTPSYEEKTAMEYDTCLKRALNWVQKNFFRDFSRLYDDLILFCEMEDAVETLADPTAAEALADVEMEFQVMQYTVTVKDALLYDMLSQLDEQERNIVLMAQWLEMTDQEIADETGLKRRTVNKTRNKTYEKLKKMMEAEGYEASSFFPSHKP